MSGTRSAASYGEDADPEDVLDSPRPRSPLAALATAVLPRAAQDARDGDPEAAAWVTDAGSVEHWCACANRSPENFARSAKRILQASPPVTTSVLPLDAGVKWCAPPSPSGVAREPSW